MTGRRALALALLAAGCAGDEPMEPPPPPDPFIAEEGDPMPPAPVEIPWWSEADGATLEVALPVAPPPDRLLPCAPGWSEITTEDGDRACAAWGLDGRPECPEGEVAAPGAACAPLGRACPATELPADDALPEGMPRFVQVGATGGDGTRAAPFGTVDEALAAAGPGDVIVLGAGTHAAPASWPAGARVEGVCAALAVLEASGPVVSVGDGSVTLGHLTLAAAGAEGAVVEGGTLELREVIVTGAAGSALAVRGGELRGAGVWVRDSAPDPDAVGLQVSGGRAELERLITDASSGSAVRVSDGAEVTLVGAALWDTRWAVGASDPGGAGAGVYAESGATVSVLDSVIERARGAGVSVSGAGTIATLDGVQVLDTRRSLARDDGFGVDARDGARIEVTRSRVRGGTEAGVRLTTGAAAVVRSSRIERTERFGVIAPEAGVSLTVEDTVIHGVESVGSEPNGMGVRVIEATDVTLARVRVDACETSGVSVEATDLELSDVEVTRTRVRSSDAAFGHGIDIGEGQLALRRVRVADNRGRGVLVFADAGLDAEDLTVESTLARSEDDPNAFGLYGADRATVTLRRARFADNETVAVRASEGATLDLQDVHIERTQPSVAGLWGLGVEAVDAAVTARRVVVDQSHFRGVSLVEGARMRAEDLVVSGTRSRADDGLGGQGVNVHESTFDAARLHLGGNRYAGLVATDGAQVSLVDLTVRDTLPTEGTVSDGFGLALWSGSDAVVSRAELSNNHTLAAFATTGATLAAQDFVVDGVAPTECEEHWCGGGTGVGAFAAGVVSLTRFRVARTTLCGLQVANLGVLTVFSGEVIDNPIGLCVQVDGYDIARLRDQVRFRGNVRAVEATTLPVPDTMTPPDV